MIRIDRVPDGKVLEDLLDQPWSTETGRARMVARVRDPATVFVYWEIDETRRLLLSRHFQSAWGQLPLVLSVQDGALDEDAAPIATIAVSASANRWYIRDLLPGRAYTIALCTTTFRGSLFAIVRSDVVVTPPDTEAQDAPVTWGKLHDNASWLVTVGRTVAQSENGSVQQPYPHEFDGYSITKRHGDHS